MDLRSFLWYLFLTAALSFKKGFSTRTLTEFGREPLLLVFKFQLNPGHPLPGLGMGFWGIFSRSVFMMLKRPGYCFKRPGRHVYVNTLRERGTSSLFGLFVQTWTIYPYHL